MGWRGSAFSICVAASTLVTPSLGYAQQASASEVLLTGEMALADIPERFRPVIAPTLTSVGNLALQLKQAGDMTLSRAILDLQRPTEQALEARTDPIGVFPAWRSMPDPKTIILSFNTLRLSASKIQTGYDPVEIYVNRLIVDDNSSVQSKPGPAGNGARGIILSGFGLPGLRSGSRAPQKGRPTGNLTIYTLDDIDGLPRILLTGGKGGKGIQGLPGDKGAGGARGTSASSTFIICTQEAGAGHAGGPGGMGRRGGDGAAGGNGGRLLIAYLNRPIQVGVETYFSAPGGAGGDAGEGGNGGPGGDGGLHGHVDGNCHQNTPPNGPQGPQGPRGEAGSPGPSGSAGRAIIEARQIPE